MSSSWNRVKVDVDAGGRFLPWLVINIVLSLRAVNIPFSKMYLSIFRS